MDAETWSCSQLDSKFLLWSFEKKILLEYYVLILKGLTAYMRYMREDFL